MSDSILPERESLTASSSNSASTTTTERIPWHRSTTLRISIVAALLIAMTSLYFGMYATERTESAMVLKNERDHAAEVDSFGHHDWLLDEAEALEHAGIHLDDQHHSLLPEDHASTSTSTTSSSSLSSQSTTSSADDAWLKHVLDEFPADHSVSSGQSNQTNTTNSSSSASTSTWLHDDHDHDLLLDSMSLSSSTSSSADGSLNHSAMTHIELRMPAFDAARDPDEYLCTALDLNAGEHALTSVAKLVGVEPLADMKTVHHMLLFGCSVPASQDRVWRCKMAAVCGGTDGSQVTNQNADSAAPSMESVLYGWGRNAPAVQLPPGTGFAVGPGSGIQYIVIQVHYLEPRPASDQSGVRLHLSHQPSPKSAGVVAFSANTFQIPPHQQAYSVPNECCYRGWETLTGFAFRVHAHEMGQLNYLTQTSPVVTDGSVLKPKQSAALRPGHASLELSESKRVLSRTVAEQSPHLPQTFYPVKSPIVIQPGDRLRATCVYNSSQTNQTVGAGHIAADEMCNFYLMVSSELPFFVWCNDHRLDASPRGSTGGLPNQGALVPEHEFWQPVMEVRKSGAKLSMPAASKASRPPTASPSNNTRNHSASAASEVPKAPQPSSEQSVFIQHASGLTVNSRGDVVLLHRGDRMWDSKTFDSKFRLVDQYPLSFATILRLNRDSGSESSDGWAANQLFLPHMISTSGHGRDEHYWVVDAGSHQVFKLNASDGRVLLTIGTAHQPGQTASKGKVEFCQPTHAIESRDGLLYVADGYCNQRIVILSARDGSFKFVWSLDKVSLAAASAVQLQAAAAEISKSLPHSLALDECAGRLYVTDREAGFVYALRLHDGLLEAFWDLKVQVGLPYAIRIGPYGVPLVLVWDRDRPVHEQKSSLVALDHGQEGEFGALISTSSQTNLSQAEPQILPGAILDSYVLPGVTSPHDFVLVPAPLELTGAGERLLSVIVAQAGDLSATGTGFEPLKKFVLMSSSYQRSSSKESNTHPMGIDSLSAELQAEVLNEPSFVPTQPDADLVSISAPSVSDSSSLTLVPSSHSVPTTSSAAPVAPTNKVAGVGSSDPFSSFDTSLEQAMIDSPELVDVSAESSLRSTSATQAPGFSPTSTLSASSTKSSFLISSAPASNPAQTEPQSVLASSSSELSLPSLSTSSSPDATSPASVLSPQPSSSPSMSPQLESASSPSISVPPSSSVSPSSSSDDIVLFDAELDKMLAASEV